MRNYPRRGGRLSLECSCAGRVVDWALTPWGDRLYGVQLLEQRGTLPDRAARVRHVDLGARPRRHAAAEVLRHADAMMRPSLRQARRLRPAP